MTSFQPAARAAEPDSFPVAPPRLNFARADPSQKSWKNRRRRVGFAAVRSSESLNEPAGPSFKFNEAISFVVNCQTQREVDYYWQKHLPLFLHGPGRDFAGVRGARVHRALVQGELSYRSFCFVKA